MGYKNGDHCGPMGQSGTGKTFTILPLQSFLGVVLHFEPDPPKQNPANQMTFQSLWAQVARDGLYVSLQPFFRGSTPLETLSP